MKKIMSIIVAIWLSIVCCLGAFAEETAMDTNVLRGAATCPACDRGTLYDWQQKEQFVTTFPCQHEKKGSDAVVAMFLVKYRSCSSCSYREELSRECISEPEQFCLAESSRMVKGIFQEEIANHLMLTLELPEKEVYQDGIPAIMRAEACPNCNGGGLVEKMLFLDYPTYTNCRHGGTGTYDVMYVTYRIHSYDCNRCNYRRILSNERTGEKVQCLFTGKEY